LLQKCMWRRQSDHELVLLRVENHQSFGTAQVTQH